MDEGDFCNKCSGRMYYPRVENCSCHINPPCSGCIDNELICDICRYTEEEKFD